MSRSRLITTIASAALVLLLLAETSARNEETVGLLDMVLGCAVIVFNKQLTRQALNERSERSGHEYDERQEKLERLVAVVVGLGFVALGASMLLGIGHIKGWN
jgi:multisubunit Na+/H+ antiporter MnhB subunit